MRMVVKGKNMEVSEHLREHAQKKLGKLDRYLENITSATVELTHEQTRSAEHSHVAQVTLVANGTILRGEERADDIRSAIDAVADVMHRQIVRYKEKLYSRGRTGGQRPGETSEGFEGVASPTERRVVKTKQFNIKPMTVDEAGEQMELLDHDFFVFYNAETGKVNVIYRRKDGDYGLIEPE